MVTAGNIPHTRATGNKGGPGCTQHIHHLTILTAILTTIYLQSDVVESICVKQPSYHHNPILMCGRDKPSGWSFSAISGHLVADISAPTLLLREMRT